MTANYRRTRCLYCKSSFLSGIKSTLGADMHVFIHFALDFCDLFDLSIFARFFQERLSKQQKHLVFSSNQGIYTSFYLDFSLFSPDLGILGSFMSIYGFSIFLDFDGYSCVNLPILVAFCPVLGSYWAILLDFRPFMGIYPRFGSIYAFSPFALFLSTFHHLGLIYA